MPNIGFDDKSPEEVSFLSKNSGIVIESGEVFTYQRPSEIEAPCYNSDSEENIKDIETHHPPTRIIIMVTNLTLMILGSHPRSRNREAEMN